MPEPLTKIALQGAMYTGKTTLARELRDNHGYILADFTSHLKKLACDVLYPLRHVGLTDIHENKVYWRPFLQELGRVIGFDTDPKYVYKALGFEEEDDIYMLDLRTIAQRDGPIVFDNVRTPEQWLVLKELGFTLVHLVCSDLEEWRLRSGLTQGELHRAMRHPIEDESWFHNALPQCRFDTAYLTAEDIAKELVSGTCIPITPVTDKVF